MHTHEHNHRLKHRHRLCSCHSSLDRLGVGYILPGVHQFAELAQIMQMSNTHLQTQIQTWKGGAHSVLRVLGLPVARHDVALLCANHELGGPCLRVVLQAASQAHCQNLDVPSNTCISVNEHTHGKGNLWL